MLARLSALLLTAIVAVGLTLPANAETASTVENFILSNGMQIVLVHDDRAPVVTSLLCYKVGSVDEAQETGLWGMAHFLEHLMFEGTTNVSGEQFDLEIDLMGATDNAFTYRDGTCYFASLSTQHLPRLMWLEADRMANLVTTDETAIPERGAVIEERNMRTDSRPKRLFYEELNQLHNPFSHPIIGYRHQIERYDAAKAINWWENFYVPNNAVLFLAGNVHKDTLFGDKTFAQLAEETFGHIPAKEVKRIPLPTRPLQDVQLRYTKKDARVTAPELSVWFRVPGAFVGLAGDTETTEDALALELLSTLLSSYDGPLYQRLVVEQKLALQIGVAYNGTSRTEETFLFHAVPNPGVSVEKLEEALQKAVLDILQNGLSQELLNNTRMTWKMGYHFSRDRRMTQANAVARWVLAGGSVDTYDDWLIDMETLTPADLKKIGLRYLGNWDRTTVGILLPKKREGDTR